MKTLRLLALGLFLVAGMLLLTGKSLAQDPKADITYMEAEESRLNLEYTEGILDPLLPPIGTFWHEIWPVYCREYELTSWEDNDGDDELSRCDQIDMIPVGGGPVEWYHVENVTITIWWEEPLKQDMGAADFMGGGEKMPSQIEDPVCTWWHVIYPPEAYCGTFHIGSWMDNDNGYLDSCDLIDRDYLSWAPETIDTVHIIRVATNITLRQLPSLLVLVIVKTLEKTKPRRKATAEDERILDLFFTPGLSAQKVYLVPESRAPPFLPQTVCVEVRL